MHLRSEQNLQYSTTSRQNWAHMPSSVACRVDAVYVDNAGDIRVNVTALRWAIGYRGVRTQTPSPAVGETGFLTFPDGRRDTPVYVGIPRVFAPLTVKVIRGAPNRSTSVTDVDVEILATGEKLTHVPYLVGLAGHFPVTSGTYLDGSQPGSVDGPYPVQGDVGLLFFRDGRTDRPVYAGRLSSLPAGG